MQAKELKREPYKAEIKEAVDREWAAL